MMFEEQRKALVAEAWTWKGTKYSAGQRLKGVVCDCLTFPMGVFVNTGLLAEMDVPYYAADQCKHSDEETYLAGLLQYCDEVPDIPIRTPLPGDLIIWKFHRVYFHLCIVLDYPMVMHSWDPKGVMRDNCESYAPLKQVFEGPREGRGQPRARKVLVPKVWRE